MPTIGTVWDRISSVVATQGYARARTPFDFDLQPDTKLDKVFHMTSERSATDGYLGGDQGESHAFSIVLAQRVARDPWGAARQLKVDMDAIEQAVLADYAAYDYNVQDNGVSSDCRQPSADADFVIGKLGLGVEFDRLMP
jgi:hypothetical protein